MATPSTKLFYLLGGYNTLRDVHKRLYDKLYAHPWLGQFFAGHNQQLIEDQQTDFMAEKFGGPRRYLGKEPRYAHEHMYINAELFELRHAILHQALVEADIPAELIERWLTIDAAFKHQLVDRDRMSFEQIRTFKQKLIFHNRT